MAAVGAPTFLVHSSLPQRLGAGGLPSRSAAAEALPAPSLGRTAYGTSASGTTVAVVTLGLGLGLRRRARGRVALRAQMVATRPDQAIPWWERLSKFRTEKGMGIWAEKLNMTSIFDEGQEAKIIPATILVVKRGGNLVTDKKWPEKHGYYSVQVGYDRYTPEQWETNGPGAARLSRLAANDLPPLKKLKEFRCRPDEWEKYEIGQKVWPSDLFKEGDLLDIHGKSIGKGFQGAIRRWGHKRGPMSHGSKHHRRYGSVGVGTEMARVLPAKKMAGWKGDNWCIQSSCKILKLIDHIDEDNMPESIIVVSGTVPGYSAHTENGGSYVYLHRKLNQSDGRFKRDPVWLWYTKKGEDVDDRVPIPKQAWTIKTLWGQDVRWIAQEVTKYWPDGFPGYDHREDPFYDDCDERLAIKAPEW